MMEKNSTLQVPSRLKDFQIEIQICVELDAKTSRESRGKFWKLQWSFNTTQTRTWKISAPQKTLNSQLRDLNDFPKSLHTPASRYTHTFIHTHIIFLWFRSLKKDERNFLHSIRVSTELNSTAAGFRIPYIIHVKYWKVSLRLSSVLSSTSSSSTHESLEESVNLSSAETFLIKYWNISFL